MEEKSNKLKGVLGLPPPSTNKPPLSPKPFTTFPMVATGSHELGWQQQVPPYFMDLGGAADTSGTKPHPKPSETDVSKNNPQIALPPLCRNPIRAVTPSSTKSGGITVKTKLGIDYEFRWGSSMDPNVNDKRLRRILSNRISAQKSRMRKFQYVNDMEKKKDDLQAKLAALPPLIESEQEQQLRLQMENLILKEKLSAIEDRAKLSLAVVKENQAVVKTLKEIQVAQQMMYMQFSEEPLLAIGNNDWNSIENDEQMMGESYSWWSNEGGPMPMMMKEEELEDSKLDLMNFTSLTIDPPESLM